MSKLGDLYNYITIQRATTAADDTGEMIPTWATLVSVFAERIEGGGGEKIMGEQITAQNYITWRMRWYDGITTKDRISYDSETYQITEITREGRKHYLNLKTYKIDG